MLTVNVCIACYRQDPFLKEAIASCMWQIYPLSVVVYNDDIGVGTGEAFNRAIAMSTADILVLLCSDDVFTDPNVISDIVEGFKNPAIGHVSRFYHQFVNGDRHPVRAWRGKVIELANNPSGMAFRRTAIQGKGLTNRMFVEVSHLVLEVIKEGWAYSILRYDTVAVRIHKSISRTPSYYVKNWTTSPVLEWAKLGWNSKDFTSLIQIKNNFTTKAVIDEAKNFIKVDRSNLLNPCFYFFVFISVCVPRSILYRIPELYRMTIGRWTTREVKREQGMKKLVIKSLFSFRILEPQKRPTMGIHLRIFNFILAPHIAIQLPEEVNYMVLSIEVGNKKGQRRIMVTLANISFCVQWAFVSDYEN